MASRPSSPSRSRPMSHGSGSSDRPAALRCATLARLARSLTAAALCAQGCGAFDSPLDARSRRLMERINEPVQTRGSALGPVQATDTDAALRQFVARATNPEATWPEATLPDGQAPASPTPPAPEIALSLAEVRAQVLRNNLDLAVVRLGPQLAQESLNAERAKFDATFVADASFSDADLPTGNSTLFSIASPDPALAGLAGVFTEPEQERQQTLAGLGVEAPLPTGGRIGVRQGFEIDDKSAPGLVSSEDRSALSFSISQPLLRGAGVDVNTASIRLAGLGQGVEEAKAKLTAVRVLASAEKAYWRLYAAQQTLGVRREQLRLAAGIAALVKQLIDAGDLPPVERFAAELAVAQQLEAVVIATTAVRIESRELSRILNRPDLPLDRPATITTLDRPRLIKFALDPDRLAARAERDRLELLELELQIVGDTIGLDLARNAALPVFVLDFQYGIGSRDSSLGSALTDSFSFENQSVSVGGRLAVPITNDAAEARVRRALLVRAQRLATRQQRQLAVRQEVYDAADIVEQNWQRVLAARQNVIAAAANYQAEQSLLSEGVRTSQQALFALQLLGEARQKEIVTIVAYQASLIDLAFATGTLLGYANAEPEPHQAQGGPAATSPPAATNPPAAANPAPAPAQGGPGEP
ncbi:MAG: transporter [Planctomyces sp.]|nr:transporter [Planctomyces sp.]